MRKFFKDTQGNMAAIMAVTLMGIILAVGAAVDIGNMQSKRIQYQDYADGAVLAAAISGETTKKKLQKIAQANVNENNASKNKIKAKLKILKNGTLHVDVIAEYDMIIMGIFGKKKSKIHVSAEAPPLGSSGKLNLALVLDVTGSMNGTRLSTLKEAANGLVDDITGGADGETMISIVPFAKYVQLPTSYENSSWINVQDGGESCWDTIDEEKSVNCRLEQPSGSGEGESPYTVCDVEVYKEICQMVTWDGCVASRVSPWHKRYEAGSSPIQGFTMEDWCHNEMLPLTKSVSAIKANIDQLYAHQETYIPAGLTWGWRALMPDAPLTEANTADKDDRVNALVLMTDGENTASMEGTDFYGFEGVYHWGSDMNAANHLTAELCESVKADGIKIYTVAFEVTDLTTISLLRNCATEKKMFFNAINANQLKSAFKDIGTGLGGGIRLSK